MITVYVSMCVSVCMYCIKLQGSFYVVSSLQHNTIHTHNTHTQYTHTIHTHNTYPIQTHTHFSFLYCIKSFYTVSSCRDHTVMIAVYVCVGGWVGWWVSGRVGVSAWSAPATYKHPNPLHLLITPNMTVIPL